MMQMPRERKMSQEGDGLVILSPVSPAPSRTRERGKRGNLMKILVMGSAVLVLLITLSWSINLGWISSLNRCSVHVPYGPKVKVFSGVSEVSSSHKLKMSIAGYIDHVVSTSDEQRDYLHTVSQLFDEDELVKRYDELLPTSPHLAQELWKYCALYEYGGLYLDAESLLWPAADSLWLEFPGNVAVESGSSFPESLQGSFLLLRQSHSHIAKRMVILILETPIKELESTPLLLPQTLYGLAQNDTSTWNLLDQRCSIDPVLRQQSQYFPNYCPQTNKYCCKVSNPINNMPILLTSYPLLPIKAQPSMSTLPKPYNPKDTSDADLPFISTIREEEISKKVQEQLKKPRHTPNFYNILKKKNCLPDSRPCIKCLKTPGGSTKASCKEKCPCYSEALCTEEVPKKIVSHEIKVQVPLFSKDPSRLIPRIVHQTWFEDITEKKYPNMKRLTNSWKESGWEYKFYNDTESERFLKEHFPPEIREAYNALLPGAFKADLFRYCVLLIYGGVYADTDVMLESNLEQAIGPHVSFMAPLDSVGTEVGKQMCLWNGLMAVAPGHPFVAKAIETSVNHARNRFTGVDIDDTFCPNPELSILHRFNLLHVTGPCMLGGAVNKVLGRHGQTQFSPGTLHTPTINKIFPGKTVILQQNKQDMGAHRFTLVEKQLLVAATDLQGYKDDPLGERIHYANQTRSEFTIYGLNGLYKDHNRANEDIRIVVNQHKA